VNVKAKGLTSVQIGLLDATRASMVLTNIAKKHSGYLFGPEGLEALLEGLLPLLHTWSEHPDFDRGKMSGPHHSIPATRVVIQNGRTADEAALYVQIGSTNLVFLVPRDKVSSTFPVSAHVVPPAPGQTTH
jgi:hypothetical protein